MSSITNVAGAETDDVSREAIEGLLDDLDSHAGEEFASVSVSHESGWNLELFTDLTVLEDVEADPGTERHLRGLSRDERLRLALLLVDGRVDDVLALDWVPGYGS